jgi:thiamine-phosphate pyrophosphorylase
MTPTTELLRILDASLNRAGEGLRVVEDFVRLGLDDPHLARLAKSLRHELTEAAAIVPAAERHTARDTLHDIGTDLSTPGEARRADAWDVCAASLKRTEQSLRSLEEYGKLVDAEFARRMELLRYSTYTLEKAIDTGRLSRERLEGVRLCVLVDGQPSVAAFESLVTTLAEAGVGMIQLRDKRLNDRELVARARLLRQSTREWPTLAVVNDRPDVAAATQCDGVHLGQEDMSVKDARSIVGPRMLIGVSTHDIAQAEAAVLEGANYLGAGPTFASQTKSFGEFAGLDYLREVAAEIRLPTFAIGGINADNLGDVLPTGISRVAVGGAVVPVARHGEPRATDAASPQVVARAAKTLIGILNRPAAEAASPSGS